jgi:hypothetical protein
MYSAAHTVPFIEFLQCGSFTHNGATYTIAAEEGATTLKSRVEDVFKLYMESTQRSAQTIRVCDLKAYLRVPCPAQCGDALILARGASAIELSPNLSIPQRVWP